MYDILDLSFYVAKFNIFKFLSEVPESGKWLETLHRILKEKGIYHKPVVVATGDPTYVQGIFVSGSPAGSIVRLFSKALADYH